MIGFGDPDLQRRGGEPGRPREQRRVVATRSYTEFWQGRGHRPQHAQQSAAAPAGDRDELRAVAQKLGAPASGIHLRQDASETTVKRAPLADYRVVYFATHGLVAGEIKGLAEPSLALTLAEAAERS